ncbi:hypothetical protein SAMN05445850_7957 [Paraburkholderia tuberum]|uniref:Uncharacterized protein n=1 Tax=Paraburkholderia tuberum TaxID=157910 RepID=A0A1H1KII0_9BURK|nr:hypothetical protein SAMN05445850_7957 [Paraburkholderia tuberum]
MKHHIVGRYRGFVIEAQMEPRTARLSDGIALTYRVTWSYEGMVVQSLSHARSLLNGQAARRPIPISGRRWPGGNTCHVPSAWRKKKSENVPVGRSI